MFSVSPLEISSLILLVCCSLVRVVLLFSKGKKNHNSSRKCISIINMGKNMFIYESFNNSNCSFNWYKCCGAQNWDPYSKPNIRRRHHINCNTLYRFIYPRQTTEDDLRTFFGKFGQVKDVKIVSDRSGLSKGNYGFVTFEHQDTAERIIKNELSPTVILPQQSTSSIDYGHQISPVSHHSGASALQVPLNSSTLQRDQCPSYPDGANFIPAGAILFTNTPVIIPNTGLANGNAIEVLYAPQIQAASLSQPQTTSNFHIQGPLSRQQQYNSPCFHELRNVESYIDSVSYLDESKCASSSMSSRSLIGSSSQAKSPPGKINQNEQLGAMDVSQVGRRGSISENSSLFHQWPPYVDPTNSQVELAEDSGYMNSILKHLQYGLSNQVKSLDLIEDQNKLPDDTVTFTARQDTGLNSLNSASASGDTSFRHLQ
ncbi:Protein boule-like protein [Echinococcus granulosus]|uniref:Protein boule-like protein n=1 Tax=Echinococcus granulosus TaxID=6210 RepID=W6UN95_ECHGR|nr:Protein boule-like protein [Echinococcus granulosus]EUB63055.1 Protein boule-like protein [Echinococcus granulosus]